MSTAASIALVRPCLWFDRQGLEAATFYTELFRAAGKPASIDRVTYYGEGGHMPEGTELVVDFSLGGQALQALNAGPMFTFSPAVSLSVACADQREIDVFWERLAEGGQHGQCGWLTDRYGLSWQVAPAIIGDLMTGDAAASGRVMRAIMTMQKIDIATLVKAHRG
ncbi:VOC family protein [Phreatobacter sp.]|uniref:VOC family protein n=1 Tax=Phreatobacter sp. TaxID=1966341 RepID=UPI003F71BF3F